MDSSKKTAGRVVFIDDDPNICNIAQKIFELSTNFDLKVINTSSQLDNLINNEIQPFDIVISDYNFSEDKSGLDIVKLFKEKEMGLYFIMISGFIEEKNLIESINLGVDNFFPKPIDWKYFVAHVKRIYQYLLQKRQFLIDHGKFNFIEGRINVENHIENILPAAFWCIEEIVHSLSGIRSKNIITALSEIITNAMEHGNLNISGPEKQQYIISGTYEEEFNKKAQTANSKSRFVSVSKIIRENTLIIAVEDCGDGFQDNSQFSMDDLQENKYYGRGLYLVKNIFHDVRFEKNGSKAILTTKIKD